MMITSHLLPISIEIDISVPIVIDSNLNSNCHRHSVETIDISNDIVSGIDDESKPSLLPESSIRRRLNYAIVCLVTILK